MQSTHSWYSFAPLVNRGCHTHIYCMIEIDIERRTLAIDALRYIWAKNPREARATYLRFMRDCSYTEIAQELQISLGRARQLAESGRYKMGKHLNRKFGKGVALAA